MDEQRLGGESSQFDGGNPGGGLAPVETALGLILESVPRIAGGETVGLLSARGRILAEDIASATDVPSFANSAMDGYALRAADARTVPVTLPVTRRLAAGGAGGTEDVLPAGEAARIFTGAALPAGADAVAIQENCRAADGEVTILKAAAPGDHVRAAGNAIHAGERLFESGHRLLPQDIGTLASIGRAAVAVRRKLKVALLATGDELARPGETLAPGQIYNGNFFALASLLQALPVELIDLGTAADNLADTRRLLAEAAAKADCVISTGGVSVGEEDHVRAAVERAGELRLWKLAIKPGKPLAFGKIRHPAEPDRHTVFFGLPGNPVSAFVTFVLIARPALLRMMGNAAPGATGYPLAAGFSRPPTGARQEYLRVTLTPGDDGEWRVIPDGNQSSGAGSSLSRSSGLLVVPPHTVVEPGNRLIFLPWEQLLA